MLKTKDDVQRVKKKKKGIDRGTGLGLRTSTARRSYFASAKHRNEFVFGPNVRLATPFPTWFGPDMN